MLRLTTTQKGALYISLAIPPDQLRPFVPERFELVTYNGFAYLTFVVYTLVVHFRGIAVHSSRYLATRTYVLSKDYPPQLVGIYLFELHTDSLSGSLGSSLFAIPATYIRHLECSLESDGSTLIQAQPTPHTSYFSVRYNLSPVFSVDQYALARTITQHTFGYRCADLFSHGLILQHVYGTTPTDIYPVELVTFQYEPLLAVLGLGNLKPEGLPLAFFTSDRNLTFNLPELFFPSPIIEPASATT